MSKEKEVIRELIIDATSQEISIALLENKELVELNKIKSNLEFSVGDIHLGKVKKVMPGLNAAFVDIGHEKDAFLHYLDLGPQFSSLSKFLKLHLSKKGKHISFQKFKKLPDINKDGKNDVITAKNYRLSELLSYRHFTHGEIEIRSWDGIGLAVLWRTRKLSGYISDFSIGDFDNDGKDELVTALVIKTGSVATTTPKSALTAFELQ